MLNRRQWIALNVTAAAAPLAWAQSDASRTLRMVVPVSPGSGTDLIARYITNGVAQAWNIPSVVENKVGANGVIGTEYVARAPADGYTLLATYSPHYTSQWTMDKVPYDAVKDFTPIATLAVSGLVLIVPADSPYKTAQELIEAARKNPDQLTYATAGVGSGGHICAALLMHLTGLKLRHVPYKNAAQPVADTAAGLVNMSFAGVTNSLGLLKAGKIRVLAVTGTKRSQLFPDVPTLQEVGVKGYEMGSHVWLMVPAGTPEAMISRLSSTIQKIATEPKFSELVAGLGLDVELEDAATARRKAPAEFQKWRMLVNLTNAKGA